MKTFYKGESCPWLKAESRRQGHVCMNKQTEDYIVIRISIVFSIKKDLGV